MREAEDAYLAGAKKLERDDLDGAERDFRHALALDPEDRDYGVAISVTRQHRVSELVRQSSQATLAGNPARAQTLLAEARAIDPQNPIVTEHSASAMLSSATPAPPPDAASQPPNPLTDQLTDRARMVLGDAAPGPWVIQPPSVAPPIRLTPSDAPQSFHFRGVDEDILRQVASAYGIRVVFDDSLDRKVVRFDLDDVHYQQAMAALTGMTRVFAVPLDETSVLIAKDDPPHRQRLERQVEETLYLPGSTPDQVSELANVVRTIFGINQTVVQSTLKSITVRAPEEILAPMNRTLQGLTQNDAEVMIEIKMYEVNTTRMTNVGAALPTQAGVYSVEQAATALVNANQALVQQAIAQGLGGLTANSSDLLVAGELIASGLVQSSLLSTTVGTIGNGLTLLGITAATNTTFNLARNSSDTRALDDVQLRVADRQPATLREGTRYPIVAATYTTGISAAASALGNATINGVSVSSLLSQFAGGTSATIPQINYEDLGLTLDATPTIQRTGRINLLLKLKIEALGGTAANGMPILENRQFNSDITLTDGDSALMVSNVSRTETAAMTGIPGLSELPGFQMPTGQNTEKDTSQLVLVITPHLVRQPSGDIAGPRIRVRSQPAN